MFWRKNSEVQQQGSQTRLSDVAKTLTSDGGIGRLSGANRARIEIDRIPPLPRVALPPADVKDLLDRHATRATSDDQVLKRYQALVWTLVKASLCLIGGTLLLVALISTTLALAGVPFALAAKIGAGSAVGLWVTGSGIAWYRRLRGRQQEQVSDSPLDQEAKESST